MRVFAAIDLSTAARAAVSETQKQAARTIGGSSLRFVKPEHLHITLAFVASLSEDRVADLTLRLTEEIPEGSFELALGGLGMFPRSGPPRVLWLGIVRGEDETVKLQRVVVDRFRLVGVEAEERPFHPHLTLARWTAGRRADRPRRLTGGDVVATMQVRAVTLFQSRPTSSGPNYTVLTHASLRAAPSSN
jgi:2'-5' RNA ligase